MVDKSQHQRLLEPLENDSYWQFTTNRPRVSQQNWSEELSEYASDKHGNRGHGYKVTGKNDENKGELVVNYDPTPEIALSRLNHPLSESLTGEIKTNDNLWKRYVEAAYRAQAQIHNSPEITVPNSDRLKKSKSEPLKYELMASSSRNITKVQSQSEVADMARTFRDICREVEDEWDKVR